MFSKNKNYHIPSAVLDSKGTMINYPQAAYIIKKLKWNIISAKICPKETILE